MAYDNNRQVYAVGSQSHVTLLDQRALRTALDIESVQKGLGEYYPPVLLAGLILFQKLPITHNVFVCKLASYPGPEVGHVSS